MPARRSSAVAQVQADADAELAADAPAKVKAANRPVRAVPKQTEPTPIKSAKKSTANKKAPAKKVAAAPKPKGPEFKSLTPAAVRPKAFRSTMIPISAIGGWEGVGDPPPDDFIDDIRRNGLEIPIVVEPEEDGSFTIVEGKRRLKAFQVLTDEGIEGFESIPAVTNPRRNQRDLRLRSLSANYQRGENVTGDARTVRDLMDAGYKDKQIAEASNTPLATIRVLRDIAFKLHPTLFAATEQNKMKPWTAKEASRLGPEGQARLIAQLELNDRVTSDDAIEARRFRVIQAADSALPKSMFDAGDADIPYDDEDEAPAKVNRDQMFANAEPKTGKKLSGADRVFNARRAVTIAKLELEAMKPANRTSREQAALDSILDAIRLLDGEDETVLSVAALDEEELEDEELEDEELEEEELEEEEESEEDEDESDDDEDEEEEEYEEEEEEEENPF